MNKTDIIMTREDVAEYMHVDTRTVDSWVKRGEIPFAKIGGAVRFKKSDIDAMFNTNQANVKQKRA